MTEVAQKSSINLVEIITLVYSASVEVFIAEGRS